MLLTATRLRVSLLLAYLGRKKFSKHGSIVTDWFSEDENRLNIAQAFFQRRSNINVLRRLKYSEFLHIVALMFRHAMQMGAFLRTDKAVTHTLHVPAGVMLHLFLRLAR